MNSRIASMVKKTSVRNTKDLMVSHKGQDSHWAAFNGFS